MSDLNSLYARVIRASRRASQLLQMHGPQQDLGFLGLQAAVEALFDNERCSDPTVVDGRRLVSLAGSLRARVQGPSIRQAFLDRGIDYSLHARLIGGAMGDTDVVAIPRRAAITLFKPLVMGHLMRSKVTEWIIQARDLVDQRATSAMECLEAVCATTLVLVSPAHGPWPLFAARCALTDDPVITVDDHLLDVLGWTNVGTGADVFPVLTAEGVQEAERLLPSALLGARATAKGTPRKRAIPPSGGGESPFDVPRDQLVEHIVDWAAREQQFALSHDDYLLLGDYPRFLS